ncbi:MAG: hypothetical protein AMXMBFR84_03210 [Candidatus Hydrogenedentota bacterium]
MSIKRTLARNTAFNAAGRLWDAALTLVLTPYIVNRIGWEAWGLWALIGSLTGYVGLLDLGMGSGLSKFIAEHAAKGDRKALSSVVSTAFFFYAGFGALLVAAGWPLCGAAIEAFAAWRGGEPAVAADAVFLARGSILLYAASMAIVPFMAVQTGLQRMGVANAVSGAASIIKAAAIVTLLELHTGVRGLIYANSASTLFVALAGVVAAYALAPGLRVSPSGISRETFSTLFAFGWRAQVARLCNLVMLETDRVIVGFVFGLTAAGLYRAGEEIANKLRQVPVLVYSAIVPAASDLDARGDVERLRGLYLRVSKYGAAVAVPMLLFGGASAGMIMRVWFGQEEGLDTAAWVLQIIAIGHLVNVLAGAGVSIALGKGRVDVQMIPGLISAGANIVLTVVFVQVVGFYGVPVATTMAMFLGWAWLLRAMGSIVGLRGTRTVRKSLLWPLVAALPGIAVCAAADIYTSGWSGRLLNGGALLVCLSTAGVIYASLLQAAPFWDATDRGLFGSLRGTGSENKMSGLN